MNSNFPWFAVRVRPNFERPVLQALEGKGYETFLPVYTEKRTWSDRLKTLSLPLFPGYLFCRSPLTERLPILTIPAVKDIIGFGKVPASIPEEEITSVRRFVESGVSVQPWPFMHCGQTVVLEKGPLAGIEGILTEIKGSSRVVVSITLLQRSIAAEVDARWVRPSAASLKRASN